MIIIVVLLLMGPTASIASLFLKKSIADELRIEKLIKSPYLYLGGTLYVVSTLLNFYLLKRLPYSLVVPLGSLTYIWTQGVAHSFLEEKLQSKKH